MSSPNTASTCVLWDIVLAGDPVGDLFRIQGTLNQHGYHSILQRYAITSSLHIVGLLFVLQQDNDPKHTSRLCPYTLFDQE
jgi:hypothetical protein